MPGEVALRGQKLKGNQSSDEEASTAGPGGDVAEHELFSQNPCTHGWDSLLDGGGASKRLG